MQLLVTILTLVGCVAVAVAGMLLIGKAPVHANYGGWSDIALPLGVTVGAMIVIAGALGGGAWMLWRAEHKMASQLLGVMVAVSAILVWKLGDALNVVLDDSPPAQHEVELVEFVSPTAKRDGYFLVTSWRVPGENISLDLPLQIATFTPGLRLRVTTHQGAFGRPYAVRLEPSEPVSP